MSGRTIVIEDVGEVRIELSDRAKHIRVTVTPFNGVRVAVPRGVPFDAAEDFARSKASWLQQQLVRMRAVEREVLALKDQRPIDRKAARNRLVSRLDALAEQHGFSYNRVFVKSQKTLWGSCSMKNNINLNINIFRCNIIQYFFQHITNSMFIHRQDILLYFIDFFFVTSSINFYIDDLMFNNMIFFFFCQG